MKAKTRSFKIKATRTGRGFRAWLDGARHYCSTSTVSEATAARHVAVRLFLGHDRKTMRDPERQRRITVSRYSAGTYLATYDAET